MHDHLVQIHSAQFEAINNTLMKYGQRISSLETVTENMSELVKVVTELTVEIKHMRGDYATQKKIFDEHESRLSIIERAPGNVAVGAWKYMIGLGLTGLAGLLFGLFM